MGAPVLVVLGAHARHLAEEHREVAGGMEPAFGGEIAQADVRVLQAAFDVPGAEAVDLVGDRPAQELPESPGQRPPGGMERHGKSVHGDRIARFR